MVSQKCLYKHLSADFFIGITYKVPRRLKFKVWGPSDVLEKSFDFPLRSFLTPVLQPKASGFGPRASSIAYNNLHDKKYQQGSKSTQKWPKVAKSGQKYQEVPKSGQKWPKLPISTQKWPKVPTSTQKWPKVAKSGQKFQKVLKSTNK